MIDEERRREREAILKRLRELYREMAVIEKEMKGIEARLPLEEQIFTPFLRQSRKSRTRVRSHSLT